MILVTTSIVLKLMEVVGSQTGTDSSYASFCQQLQYNQVPDQEMTFTHCTLVKHVAYFSQYANF